MEKYRPQPERKHNAPEGGQDSHGFQNRQPEQVPHGGGIKNPERQPLPNVLDVLERYVKLEALDAENQIRPEEYEYERRRLRRVTDKLHERGTPRDKLILNLYSATTHIPHPFGTS
jgi:hypothetical protein